MRAPLSKNTDNNTTIIINNTIIINQSSSIINQSSSLPYPPLHSSSSSLRGSFRRLFGCCMRPHTNVHDPNGSSLSSSNNINNNNFNHLNNFSNNNNNENDNEFNNEFGRNVFTQLGPNDVSYKTRSEPKMVHQYVLGGLLGEGSYAKVREAVDSITQRKVAIKILSKRKLKKLPGGESSVKKEIDVLHKLRHCNIVELIDYFTIEEKEKMYIVLEYVGGGTLQGLIERAPGGIIPRKQAQMIFRQLLAAVEYIHAQKIVHCDIKPDNLMFSEGGDLKMTDFGVAEEIGMDNDYEILTKSGGSPAFQPPEIKVGTNFFSPVKIDIWSIGITLYIMVVGKYPFSGTNIYTICDNIAKGEYLIPDAVEPDLAELIRGILQIDPGARMTLQEMKVNSWVTTDIISDEPHLPYINSEHATPHNIFAQNYRVAAGQGLYADSGDDDYEEEEPTVFALDDSGSNYSSGIVQHPLYKLGASEASNASPQSSMTNLPTATLTSHPTNPSPTNSPKPRRKGKCSIM